MSNLIKSLVFVLAVTSVSFSAAFGVIDGKKVFGTGKGHFNAINTAVTRVKGLKEMRAKHYITAYEYSVRVKNIIRTLRLKGLNIQ